MPASSATQCTLVAPRLACRSGKEEDPIECSVHTLPKPLMREFSHVFGERYNMDEDGDSGMGGGDNDGNMQQRANADIHLPLELLAIPTNQHARHDLVAVGDEIEEEKDRLLNCVSSFAIFHRLNFLEPKFSSSIHLFSPFFEMSA